MRPWSTRQIRGDDDHVFAAVGGGSLGTGCGHNHDVSARIRAVAYRLAMRLLPMGWVLRRPRSRGVRCILCRGDAVVLARHSYGDRRWMLPGGRIRRREGPL